MFDAVIRAALKNRLLVVVLSLVVLVYGGYLTTQLPIDVLPDLDRPRVVILTEAAGLAAEEIETLVTQLVETAVLGAAGVEDVRSQSAAGLSVVYVEFGWAVDVRAARQTVQERLATLAGQMPPGVTPMMTPNSSIMGQIVLAGLYRQRGPTGGRLAPAGTTGLMVDDKLAVWKVTDRHAPQTWEAVKADRAEWTTRPTGAAVTIAGKAYAVTFPTPEEDQRALRTAADWVVRPRLRKIPGIAEVFIQGGERKQYQVLVEPAALLEYGVTLGQVEQALKDNNVNASGGFALRGDTERPIRILGRLGPGSKKVLEELRKVPVKMTEHRTVLLEQVAKVVEGSAFKRGDGSVNGEPGVVLTIAKQPHVDTRALTDQIAAALSELEASLPADVVINSELFRMKNFIDRGIYNVGEALVIGAVLVLIVLFLFLMNVRTTFITLTAIPLSLVITTLVFRVVGWASGTHLSINVMTLGGIAVAMGELVDDAVVDVENIYRRLKENRALAEPKPALTVVYEASREIRSAIVFGTVVVILVFMPLFALSGVEGRLFAPLGVAYITSILASLLVSLTVTPVLSYYLLARTPGGHHEQDSLVVRGLKWAAAYLIRFSMRYATLLLLVTWAMVAVSALLLTRLGADFLPPFDEGSVQVNLNLPPGSSLEASNAAAALLDRKFRSMRKSAENPRGDIVHFVRRTGRADLDEHAMAVSGTEYILSINPKSARHREEILGGLLKDLQAEVPGADLEVEQPLAHAISHMISGVTAQIAIKVYGDDLNTLVATAERIKSAIGTVPGVTPPVVEPIRLADELHVRLRPDDLAFHGVSRAYVAEFVQTALLGEPVSQVLEGQRRFDLVVRLEEAARTDYTRLGQLRVDLPDGRGQVRLADLADIGDDAGANGVNRDNARRRIVIRCNAQGRDLAGVVADIQTRVRAGVTLPEGYFVEYGGQFESQRRATILIGALAGVAGLGMFVVLLMLYPSVRVVLQILNALP
ncbi:MAG: efflux RND transporter permease subunit, partial [Gemmataceae bacterium]